MAPRLQLLSRGIIATRNVPRTVEPTHRNFTTTAALCARIWKRGGDTGSHKPKHVLNGTTPDGQPLEYPEYPHGPALLFKQSNKGLYGGARIQFGNNVSPKTETKTRRHWKPNVLNKALYSVALDKKIKLRVTANVLKTIDREGGLDEYLLKDTDRRIKDLGPTGWALRCRILQTPAIILRMRAEAEAAGLPEEEIKARWPNLDEMEWQAEEKKHARRVEVLQEHEKRRRKIEKAAEDLVTDVDQPEITTMAKALRVASKRLRDVELHSLAKDFINDFKAETYRDGLRLAELALARQRRRERRLMQPLKTELDGANAKRKARLYVRLGLVDTIPEGLVMVKERADKLRAQEAELLARFKEQAELEERVEEHEADMAVEQLEDEWEELADSKAQETIVDLTAGDDSARTSNTNAKIRD